MDRRQFIERAAAAAAVLPITSAAGEAGQSAARSFKLKYAPHIGMFEQSAGKDPLDQIRFMADNGFRAFEDNGMMARTPDLQQAMGDLLAKRGHDDGRVRHRRRRQLEGLAGDAGSRSSKRCSSRPAARASKWRSAAARSG